MKKLIYIIDKYRNPSNCGRRSQFKTMSRSFSLVSHSGKPEKGSHHSNNESTNGQKHCGDEQEKCDGWYPYGTS